MNMKKTMAAIAAGAVAVSAMATTVSADNVTIPTKTLKYNLVQTKKVSSDAEVKLTAKFFNVPLVAGETARFSIKNLNDSDIVRISGTYLNENMQIVPITATKDQSQAGIYSVVTANKMQTGANGYIDVDIVAANANKGFTLRGGTPADPGTPAGADTDAAITNGGMATAPTVANAADQTKLNNKATDDITVTYAHATTNFSVVVGTNPAVTKTAAELLSEYGITATAVAADDTKGFTVSKFVAGDPEVPATPAVNVSADIMVEVTKKKLGSITGTANDITDKDNGLKNVNAELGRAGAPTLGIGLMVDGTPDTPSTNTFDVQAGTGNANAFITATDHVPSTKWAKFPYQSSLTNTIGATLAGETSTDVWGTAATHGGDVLNHIWEAKDDDTSKQISPISVRAVINDAIQKHGEVTFTFNTAAHPVQLQESGWYYDKNKTPAGAYAPDDWAGSGENCLPCTSFGNHLFNQYQVGYDPNTTYIMNEWKPDNLFTGALLVNSNLTLSLSDTAKFDWTDTSLSFTWEGIQDSALTQNQYANYIQNMVLRTSSEWYWDSLEVVLGETEVEEVESGAPVEGDVEDLPEDEEETDLGDVDEPEEEEEEESEPEPEPEVAPAVETNPGTGNAPVALAVIPVALAAAAIVAKKRG